MEGFSEAENIIIEENVKAACLVFNVDYDSLGIELKAMLNYIYVSGIQYENKQTMNILR